VQLRWLRDGHEFSMPSQIELFGQPVARWAADTTGLVGIDPWNAKSI